MGSLLLVSCAVTSRVACLTAKMLLVLVRCGACHTSTGYLASQLTFSLERLGLEKSGGKFPLDIWLPLILELQGGHPVNARSCKHLRAILGDKYEDERLRLRDPDGQGTTSKNKGSKSKPSSQSKVVRKRKKNNSDGDDDDDDDDSASPAKKVRTSPRKGKNKRDSGDEDAEDEDEDEDDLPQAKKAPELLLANKWDLNDGPDPAGWWMSEKLDGVR
jgi:hypothetical protein